MEKQPGGHHQHQGDPSPGRQGRREVPRLPHQLRQHGHRRRLEETSREGRDYISVKLDDPSFPAAIYATLSETETAGEYALIWSPLTGQRRPAPPSGGVSPC